MTVYNCTDAEDFASKWSLREAGDVYNLADGNHFTVENGGVTTSATDLPPGA